MHNEGDISPKPTRGVLDFSARTTLRRIWPLQQPEPAKPAECSKCAELIKAIEQARDYSPGYGLTHEILENALSKARK